MSDYTQEQVEKMISEAVNKATSGLLTEDEVNKRVTAEVDRRVESGIQKGIETQRKKWQQEFEAKAQMTAEELAKQEIESKLSELTSKERELLRKENLLNAKDVMAKASIPQEHFEKFIDVLVLDDVDKTNNNVQNFIEMFNATKTDIESKIKTELSNVKPPSSSTENDVVTKDRFDKMSYSEKLTLKQTNPDVYSSLISE